MPTSSQTFDWSLELTAADRDPDYTVIIDKNNFAASKISLIHLDEREDVLSSVLEIKFPSIEHFYDTWSLYNPFAHGSVGVLKIEGVPRFTGTALDFNPVYSANDRSCVVTFGDKLWAAKDAMVDLIAKRRVIRELVKLTRKAVDSQIFVSDPGTYPWAAGEKEDYVIPVWVKDPSANAKSYRVIPTEYQCLYSYGAIYFSTTSVKILSSDVIIDPDGDGEVNLDDVENEIYAEIAYYDETDDSTQVDKILKTVFEISAAENGLGWTEGVDFNLEATPQDKINALEWHTKHGDGDLQAFISNLYDNIKIGFPVNYWIRDFEGNGVVTGKYVFQQSGLVFNGDFLIDPSDIPSGNFVIPAGMVYDGVNFCVNKTGNGTGALTEEIYARETETYRVRFTISNYSAGDVTPSLGGTAGTVVSADGTYTQYIICGAWGGAPYTRFLAFTPSNTARFSIDDIFVSTIPKDIDIIYNASLPSSLRNVYTKAILVNNASSATPLSRNISPVDVFPLGGYTETPDAAYPGAKLGPDVLTDNHFKSAWGYFKIGVFPLDEPLPRDTPLFRLDLGSPQPVDKIIYGSYWTFTGDEGMQPWLVDSNTGKKCGDNIYLIYEPQRITVEGNTSLTNTPDPAGWFCISPELFLAEGTPGLGASEWHIQDAIKTVENISCTTRHLRVICNNPLFAKVGEKKWSAQAYRMIVFWMNEFMVFSKNRLLDMDGELPEVAFTNDPDDEYRYRFGVNNTIVDMYRPILMAKLNSSIDGKKLGLENKPLIIESDDLFDFQQKLDPDPENVSIGYKYLVSRLDAASKENELSVEIDPRPDIRIGDTVFSSRMNPDVEFLVHGNMFDISFSTARQNVVLSNHDFKEE